MNKKGFVLVETLVVTIFTMFIFTVLYNSVVPLLGKYKELSYYDDLDTTYELYYLKNMIMGDANFSIIKESEYQKISCNDLNNPKCIDLYNFLDIKESDSVLFINTDNLDIIQDDEEISVDIKNYLKYIKTDSKEILLLEHEGYLSYMELVESINLSEKIFDSIENSTCEPSILEDGITYLSGTNECVNFNYVWYSGKLWRITAIYPDGSMKMVTDDLMTVINWGEKATVSDANLISAYESSWVREWLNQEFLPTLYNYKNIIDVDAGWYSITDNNAIPIKPTGEYTLIDPVGLLNGYEYYMSYRNTSSSSGYLNIGYAWWTMTPYNSTSIRYIGSDGDLSYCDSDINGLSIRPTVKLKFNLKFKKGEGTKNNPYIIKGDKEEVISNKTLLNTRSSGEYVRIEGDLNNRLFRIIDFEKINENLTTKIVLNDYVKENGEYVTKKFSGNETEELWSEVSASDTTFLRGYLNQTWLNTLNINKLEKGIYYFGYHAIESYKSIVCNNVSSEISIKECIESKNIVSNIIIDDYVGLLRVGEMFAVNYQDEEIKKMALINPYNKTNVNIINNSLTTSKDSSYIRPTINLKSTIIIKSGSGTKDDPFIVG